MKKERQVKSYQRRTKSGKTVTVKAHTAKYDAAEEIKEILKKKGAGKEIEDLKKHKELVQLELPFEEDSKESAETMYELDEKNDKKKKSKPRPIGSGTNGPEPKKDKDKSKKTSAKSSSGEISSADFKAWYHWDMVDDPKNPAAKRVEKALKTKLGTKGYKKFFDEMSDSYSARGHLKAYKSLSEMGDSSETPKKSAPKKSKSTSTKETKISTDSTGVKKVKDTIKDLKNKISIIEGKISSVKAGDSGADLAKWHEQRMKLREKLKEAKSSLTELSGKPLTKKVIKEALHLRGDKPSRETLEKILKKGYTSVEALKSDRRQQRAIKDSEDYIKHMNRLGWPTESYKKACMEEHKHLKEGGKPLSDSEINKIEKGVRDKHKLTYEGDGVLSNPKGKAYRITVDSVTGKAKLHSLGWSFSEDSEKPKRSRKSGSKTK